MFARASEPELGQAVDQTGLTAADVNKLAAPLRVVILVELRCLLCARTIGSLEAERWLALGPMLFRPAGVDHPVWITDWRRIRCALCGGNSYPDEVTTVRVYPPIRWDDSDRPRRGRPPKWLVAARRAEAASDE